MQETGLKPNNTRIIVADTPLGYSFTGWTGDVQYLQNPLSATTIVNMPNIDINITANFNVNYTNVIYGYLYNGYAARDSRNLANIGWRVPTKTDVDTLINLYGGYTLAGGHLKEAGTVHWQATNNADNSSGFSALGAGNRFGSFSGRGTSVNFYSQTNTGDSETMYSFSMNNSGVSCSSMTNWLCYGSSIRLIKEDSNYVPLYIGNDGKVYRTVQIGSQIWLLESLAETYWRTGEIILNATADSSWNSRGVPSARCSWNNIDSNI